MLYREKIAVCSDIRIRHTNAVCGQNVELVNVERIDAEGNRRALKV
jgi:hypothetical protein